MEEIDENNKLIAEFMGFKMLVENYYGINIIESPTKQTFDLHGLKYHTSWDWLMPVVEKIAKIKHFVTIDLDFEYVNVEIGATPNICNTGQIKPIETLYETVVEFIKWYNWSQNKKWLWEQDI